MAFPAEAQIARELMKFAAQRQLYRGSKPVMWSVVEKTALAEAEVEYEDYTSDTVWVKFPADHVSRAGRHAATFAVAKRRWSSGPRRPWTLPGNRAISFLVEDRLRALQGDGGAPRQLGEDWRPATSSPTSSPATCSSRRASRHMNGARRSPATMLARWNVRHPLRGFAGGYDFGVPLLDGDHVTDDTGTGFVHTAPGHGREDFDVWTANGRAAGARGINTAIPYTVDENGAFTAQAPGFTGKRVITDKGEKGDANEAVIKALVEAGMMHRARPPQAPVSAFVALQEAGDLPQHAAMVHRHGQGHRRGRPANGKATRCARARSHAIAVTRWVPPQGENRITGMIEQPPRLGDLAPARLGRADRGVRPRQGRRLGRHPAGRASSTSASPKPSCRKAPMPGTRTARERFLGISSQRTIGRRSTTSVDVWFDSGSTHAFVLEDPQNFPPLAGIRRRKIDGGLDTVMYLEGTDQHRGWFHSSLLESTGTRGRAPYDVVLTHGFALDENGRKMSKSLGNTRRAAGGDLAVQAPTSCACGCARPTMPTISASARRS